MAYTNKDYFLTKVSASKLQAITEDATDSTTNLDAAIASADSLINSYLANQITTLPLTDVPPMIKEVSFDIAFFYLHKRNQSNDIPQHVKDAYDASLKTLTDISGGKIVLFPKHSADDIETTIEVEANTLVFNRGLF